MAEKSQKEKADQSRATASARVNKVLRALEFIAALGSKRHVLTQDQRQKIANAIKTAAEKAIARVVAAEDKPTGGFEL